MENASKALLMAGGVLIALLILGSLVMLFTNLQDYQNSQDVSAKQSQIAKFNNQFEPYNKSDLTLMELKSLYNKILSNNTKYPEYEITQNIVVVYPNIIADFNTIDESDKITKVFKCILVKYENDAGRISEMKFQEITT